MRTVVRPDAKGDPDDVAISDVTMFRMERMDSGKVWIAVYRGEERVCFWLDSARRIRMTVGEDELGARGRCRRPDRAARNPPTRSITQIMSGEGA